MSTPYSYVTSGGVANTRVRVSGDDADLGDLQGAFAVPVVVDVPAIKYHNGTKRERSAVKKELPYFVGGPIEGRRHDDHVLSRTLLTLDVEQGDEDESPPPDPATVAARLQELDGSGWLYTSISHTPKSPRYRVVLPLAEPITGSVEEMGAALQASTLAAAEKLGIAEWTKPESWVVSQPMYVPAQLRGGKFFQSFRMGKSWRTASAPKPKADRKSKEGPADILDLGDPILQGLKSAGLYLGAKRGHKGMHFITCPFQDLHDNENETQTVYYEAHFDGNPRPACKCFDTAPDVDGTPHLSYTRLVRYLRKEGHLVQGDDKEVLDDYEAFDRASDMSSLLDGAPIPQEWAIPQFAPIGRVTVLGGPGGQGKTLALLHVLVHAACGMQWGEFRPDGPVRSLYVSYEDGPAQLQGRVQAIAKALGDHGATDLLYDVQGSVRRNLRAYAADEDAEQWLLLVKPERYGTPEATERVEWLVGYLKSRKIRMLVLDPVVFTHRLSENDIADMAHYMQTLTHIAREAQCAIVVIHHMSKQGGFGGLDMLNQNSLRGASSIADNSRSVMAGIQMPMEDCEAFGVDPDNRHLYFVLKHVKHNYSAPMALQVFRNEGGLMQPAPTVRKMDKASLTTARETAKEEEVTARMAAYVPTILSYLAEQDEPSSLNHLSVGCNVRKPMAARVLEHCLGLDYIDQESGPNRSVLSSITKLGRQYLKANVRKK